MVPGNHSPSACGECMNLLFQLLGICRHQRISRVFSNGKGGHYVVCLDCAAKAPYSWDEMHIGESREDQKALEKANA